ncbi:MAG: hypothetical protein EBY43_05280, partial [Opitutae bacterium]|nr:hypothetical protein [Opitutae bacterium]
DNEVGSIEAGKWADFIILDAELSLATLKEINIDATYLAGKLTYKNFLSTGDQETTIYLNKDRATLVFVAELDEAVEIADKIVVLHEGSYAGIFENKENNIADILSLYSGKPSETLAEARGSLNG